MSLTLLVYPLGRHLPLAPHQSRTLPVHTLGPSRPPRCRRLRMARRERLVLPPSCRLLLVVKLRFDNRQKATAAKMKILVTDRAGFLRWSRSVRIQKRIGEGFNYHFASTICLSSSFVESRFCLIWCGPQTDMRFSTPTTKAASQCQSFGLKT